MKLVKPTLLDLIRLHADARPDEIEQYTAITGARWDVDELAHHHFGLDGVKFCLLDHAGDPVVAAGFHPVGARTMRSWMVGSMDAWADHWRTITKITRRTMDTLISQDISRLETYALASRTQACEWYERGLHMQFEGIQRCRGMNGEDVAMYSRIRRV